MILLLEKTINNFLGNIIIKRDWRLNSCFSSLLSVVVQFGARYNILHPALNLHLISFSEVASLLVPPASGFSKLEVSQSGWHLKIHQCAQCWVMGGWHNIRTPMGWHQHVQTSWKYLALVTVWHWDHYPLWLQKETLKCQSAVPKTWVCIKHHLFPDN
jgi:hypothetical protein